MILNSGKDPNADLSYTSFNDYNFICNNPIYPITSGIFEQTPVVRMDPNVIQLFLSCTGYGKVYHKGKMLDVGPNHLIIYKENTPIMYEPLDKDKTWITAFVTLKGSYVSALLDKIDTSVYKTSDLYDVLIDIKQLTTLIREKNLDDIECSVQTYKVVAGIFDSIKYPITDSGGSDNLINKAILYILDNVFGKISTEAISAAIGCNRKYLSQIFKKNIGISIPDYINRIRIHQAQVYQKMDNTIPVTKLASMCGFSNPTHFIAVYKNIAGFTPYQGRKMTFKYSTAFGDFDKFLNLYRKTTQS